MGVNWLPGMNPETMPRLCYVPKIALPTVFGDALSYMEMVNQINYHFNQAIDGVNKLAEDITVTVENAIKDAKIPVYANIVHDDSNIISPNNWNVDDPKAIFDGMSAGKMCILFGHVGFNGDGVPVVQNKNNMYFVLTEFYQNVVGSNSTTARAVFVNYDDAYVRYLEIQFEVDHGDVTSEVLTFTEYALPTTEDFDLVYKLMNKDVCVYKGDTRIGATEGQYIELTDNGIGVDLSDDFVVQDDSEMYATECAPCVVIDYMNGRLGQLKFGGNETPWVRIYSYGVTLFNDAVRTNSDSISALSLEVAGQGETITTQGGLIDTANGNIATLRTDVDNLDGDVVKYTSQSKTSSEKAIARNNIEAVARRNAVVYDSFTIFGSYWTIHAAFNETQVAKTFELDGDGGDPIIRGVADPVNDNDVATKKYVDDHTSGSESSLNAVSYNAQSPSESEKATARTNIGAVANENGTIVGTLSLQSGDTNAVALAAGQVGSDDTLTFTGDNGDVIVRGVKTPAQNNDAVNKAYSDLNKPLVINLQYDGYSYYTDATGNQVRAAISNRRPIYGVLSDTRFPYLDGAVVAFSLMNPTGSAEGYLNAFIESEGGKYEVIVEFATAASVRYYINTVSDGTVDSIVLTDRQQSEYFVEVTFEQDTIILASMGDEDYPVILYNLRDGADPKCAATKGYVDGKYVPYNIAINGAENAWTGTKGGTAITNLASVISAFSTGAKVIVSYPTTGVAGVGYASPKCVSTDTGIIVEAYNGTVWKRYTINSDGTVTTVTL